MRAFNTLIKLLHLLHPLRLKFFELHTKHFNPVLSQNLQS